MNGAGSRLPGNPTTLTLSDECGKRFPAAHAVLTLDPEGGIVALFPSPIVMPSILSDVPAEQHECSGGEVRVLTGVETGKRHEEA